VFTALFHFREDFVHFFDLIGDRYLAAGDYNAKHTHWVSGLKNPKGRQLYKAIIAPRNKPDLISPGKPTYWSPDSNKNPDLIDFAVTRRVP